jgi:VanZ family protein
MPLRQISRPVSDTRMLHTFSTAIAWVCLAFIVYATFVPPALRPALLEDQTPPVVTVERVGAFAMLGFFFALGYPKDPAFVIAIVFGSAVLFEILQALAPSRHARAIDAIEKLVGGSIGIVAARLLSLL